MRGRLLVAGVGRVARGLKSPDLGVPSQTGVTGKRGSQRGSRDALPALATLTTQAAAVAFLLSNMNPPACVQAGGSLLPDDGATGKPGVGLIGSPRRRCHNAKAAFAFPESHQP